MSLLWVEVADTSVVREEVTALEELGDEVDVPVILHEAVVFHLKGLEMGVDLQ